MIYVALLLSVLLGFTLATILKHKLKNSMSLLLAFSGAFLLAVTVFEMLPEVYENYSKRFGLFIMLGLLLQIFLDFFSKGAEHGHVHIHEKQVTFPWLLFLSLSIHAFLEGFPVQGHNGVFYGILIHKIPIAMILTLFLMEGQLSKSKIALFLFSFALMTPLGAFVASKFSFFDIYKQEIDAIVIGVFLHVSTTIIFESSKDHKFNLAKLVTIILGVMLAYFL